MERAAEMNLRGVDLGREPGRMTNLEVGLHTPCAAVLNGFANASNIAVEQVHSLALNFDPSTAVDPGTPISKVTDSVPPMLVVNLGDQLSQVPEVKRVLRSVVETQVDV
jgi:hypothetical protein